MARRRALGRLPLLALLSILIVGALIGFSKLTEFLSVIPADFRTIIFWALIASLSAIVAGVYTSVGVRRLRRERAREAATLKARAATEEHLPSLVKKREQLVQKDSYGKPLLDRWTEEIAHFVADHIKPTLTRRERLELDKEQGHIAGMIDTRVQVERDENSALKTFSDDMRTTAFPPEEVWYYGDGEDQVGPVTLDELRGTLATHSNASEVFVWCARFPDWKEAGDVPELKLALHSGLRQDSAA
jgi:GYF domain 2